MNDVDEREVDGIIKIDIMLVKIEKELEVNKKMERRNH